MHEYKLQQGLVTPRPNRCDFYAQTIRPTSSLSLASLLGSSSCHMLQRLSHQLLPAEMDRSTQPQSREGGVQPYGFGRAAGSYDPLVRFFLFLVNLLVAPLSHLLNVYRELVVVTALALLALLSFDLSLHLVGLYLLSP
uniref:Uncharacterized protein n=1 Tax=Guillardia theta TaxID=55529 RepID=A0A7S4NHV4_GUITH